MGTFKYGTTLNICTRVFTKTYNIFYTPFIQNIDIKPICIDQTFLRQARWEGEQLLVSTLPFKLKQEIR